MVSTSYTATVELDSRDLTEAALDRLMDALAGYHPALGRSVRGRVEATVSLPAESLTQAATTALAVLASASTARPIAVQVTTTDEHDAALGLEPLPELTSVSEAAATLGVSRQRVLQLLEAGHLAGQKVGNGWVIHQAAVDARAQASDPT